MVLLKVMSPCFKRIRSADGVFNRSGPYSLGELDGLEEWE